MSGPVNYRIGRRKREPKCELTPATHAVTDAAYKAWEQRQAARQSSMVKFIPKRR